MSRNESYWSILFRTCINSLGSSNCCRQTSIEAKSNLTGTADQTISRLIVDLLQKYYPSKTSCLCCATCSLLFLGISQAALPRCCYCRAFGFCRWQSAVGLPPAWISDQIHRAALLKKPSGFEKENKNSGVDGQCWIICDCFQRNPGLLSC